jgi:hypothetical protein
LLAIVGGLLIVVPASHAAGMHLVPSAIAGDCSTDVTRPISAWIASVRNHSVLAFAPGACYRIDGTLELHKRRSLRFEGGGATFQAATPGDGTRSQWRAVGGSGLVFRNMTIRGANPAGTFVPSLQHQHAFDLAGAADVLIDHVNAADLYGDCFYMGLGWDNVTWSRNIAVRDSTCRHPGRMGVAVTAGRDVLVQHSSFDQIGLDAFDVEPNGRGWGASRLRFTQNRIGRVYDYVFVATGHGPVHYVRVDHNTMVGKPMQMAVLAPPNRPRSHITITRNTSDTGYYDANGSAMQFVGVHGLTVTRNVAPLSGPNMALVTASASCRVKIQGNRYPGGVVQARIRRAPCAPPRPRGRGRARSRSSPSAARSGDPRPPRRSAARPTPERPRTR